MVLPSAIELTPPQPGFVAFGIMENDQRFMISLRSQSDKEIINRPQHKTSGKTLKKYYYGTTIAL